MQRDTIFALSTAPGRSAIAIIRLSGPRSVDAITALTGSAPAPRCATLQHLKRPETGETIDSALVLIFEEGRSFTGDAMAEIQCHGGRAVVDSILRALSGLRDLRPATPGEFTRRALEAGRMDLAQVEGLADLIDAETESQRNQALSAMHGALSSQVDFWRKDLIRARALVEAVIDFADEEVPEDVTPEVTELLAGIEETMNSALLGAGAAERVRDGFVVALIGAPNAGKSTLLNALAGREAAITSEVAGTTRDVIEVHMDVRGLPVTMLDTAGLRETENKVEAIGVARARTRAADADLRVMLRAPDDVAWADSLMTDDDIFVASKADLSAPQDGLAVSAISGLGLADLMNEIADRLSQRAATASTVFRVRQKVALESALKSIEDARAKLAMPAPDLDLVAEDLRASCNRLDAILGRVDVEHVLDDVFSSFCLGK